jgi:Mn-containing catalase
MKENMFLSIKKLPNKIPPADKPDPKAAQALQEGLGGQFGGDENYDAISLSEYEL